MQELITTLLIVIIAITVLSWCRLTTSGLVSTDGSTSIEKVIGALGEAFSADNPDITLTSTPLLGHEVLYLQNFA